MIVPTKRVILSFIARLFDPLGFLNPYIMVAKVLFQELWALGLQWDEIIPPELSDRFNKWLSGLEALKEWKLSRRFVNLPWNEVKSRVHLFFMPSEMLRKRAMVPWCTFVLDCLMELCLHL